MIIEPIVQLSHNLLKNIISGPVDGPKHTPNKFDDIEELTFGADAPSTTSFVRQHFQEACRLHSFDQCSMRLYMYQCTYHHGRRHRGTGERPPKFGVGTVHASVPPIFLEVVLSDAY